VDGLSEFQARAAALRKDREGALGDLRAKLAAAAAAQGALEKARTTQGRDQGETLRAATRAQEEAAAALGKSRDGLLGVEGRLSEWIGEEAISDPRRRIEGLDDRVPILLLPVRIETRFFGGTDKPELRVRIFPDDVAITTHEATLSAGEAEAGRQFWRDRAAAMQVADAVAREAAIEGAWTRLVLDHGEPRGSFILIRLRPENWDDTTPPLPAGLTFPDIGPERPDTVAGAVPRSRVMPERFVVRLVVGAQSREALGNPIPDDLIVGPDPKQLESVLVRDATTGRLKPDARLAWLFDFDAAVTVGLAVRIPLEPAWPRTGIDRVIVLGLKLSAGPTESAALVEGLVEGHRHTGGFDILPQGTPTNNTEKAPAGFSSAPRPTPDTYRRIVKGEVAEIAPVPEDRTDAEQLATALGIDFAAVNALSHATLQDVIEAFAMNRALWSATIGGYLEKLIPSALSPSLDTALRGFFLDHVSGRGTVPSVRVGRQPYGVLVTSALGRWQWSKSEAGRSRFPGLLLAALRKAYADWSDFAAAVPQVGLDDPNHTRFMAVVGLQASSATYAVRKGVTDLLAWNWLQYSPRWAQYSQPFWDALRTGRREALARLGFDLAQEDLKLAEIAFLRRVEQLDGPVIDGDPELPLSEKDPITPFDPVTKQNYIHWLATAAPEAIQSAVFKLGDGTTVPAPKALLYKYLRHALLADASSTAIAIARLKVPALSAFIAVPAEPDIVNVGSARVLTKPQMLGLNARALGLTHNDLSLGNYVLDRARVGVIRADDPPELQVSADLVRALAKLAGLPTAVLERLFAEHIDLGSYRLDAWITGIFDRRLRTMRSGEQPVRGLHIGAYGYVENLRPNQDLPVPVDPASLPPELKADAPVVSRASNGGFVHAPSLMHGVTAAVLRNAYLSNSDPARPDAMSVNLSSRRVRLAMDYVEGIRNGQELGALLGYQIERGLHENHPGVELDEFIYVLRDRFPFVSKKISPVPDGTAAEVVEARNVINGYELLGFTRGKTYPYGIAGLPGAGTAANAIIAEVARLDDAIDAVGDLMLAESVHQVVGGNYDRARSVLQALGEGEGPPIPDVAATPRSGRLLVQRIAVHFPDGPGWTGSPPVTPRAAAAPRLNHWLTLQLPSPATIRLTFTFDGIPELFSLADIGLDAIDVVLMCGQVLGGGASQIERFIVDRYRAAKGIADDVTLFFRAKDDVSVPEDKALIMDPDAAGPGGVSLEALWPHLNHLRDLITRGRPLDASDYRPSTAKDFDKANPKGFDGAAAQLSDQADYVTRANDAIAALTIATDALRAKLDEAALKSRIDGLFAEPPVFVAADWTADLAALRTLLRALVQFGVPEALPGSVRDPVAPEVAELAARSLVAQAMSVRDLTAKRVTTATEVSTPPPPAPPPTDPDAAAAAAAAAIQEIVDRTGQALRHALGEDMPLTPLFGLDLTAAAEVAAASADPIASGPLTIETWLQSLSRVRDSASSLAWVASGREWLLGTPLDMIPVQTPRAAGDPWIGGAFSAATLSGDVLSVMTVTPALDPTAPLSGLMLDDWSEIVPGESETTGLAFHFDRPNAAAPQALLLAVSPTLDGAWEWADLVAIVEETFDRAKTRAVEPDQLIGTDYFNTLPATLLEFSTGRMYLSTELVANALQFAAQPG